MFVIFSSTVWVSETWTVFRLSCGSEKNKNRRIAEAESSLRMGETKRTAAGVPGCLEYTTLKWLFWIWEHDDQPYVQTDI
jgi:hypothetical protein